MRPHGLVAGACALGVLLISGGHGAARGAAPQPPRPDELAFVRGELFRSGHIWLADLSGKLRQLTRGRMEVDPSWSPDGRRLAYVGYSHTPSGAGAHTDLYVLDLASGKRRRVTNDVLFEATPSWSPDGTKLVYTANGLAGNGRDPLIVSLAGGKPRRLVSTARYEGSPRWSPRGGRILFLSAIGDLYVIRPDGTGERRLLREVSGAQWSPTGREIELVRADGLYRARPDGTNVRRISTLAALPARSPDGRMLAYDGDARDVCGAGEYRPVVVLAAADGSEPPRARACTEAEEFSPVWRPRT